MLPPRRSLCALVADDEPVAHADDPVAGRTDLRIVGDDDEGLATLTIEPTHERQHVGRPRGVEVSRRLVAQDDHRIVDEGSRDRDALLLAAGKLHRPVSEPVGQSDRVQRPVGSRARRTARRTGVLRRQRNVLPRRQRGNQVERLEYEAHGLRADLRALSIRERRRIGAIDPEPWRQPIGAIRRVEQPEDVHQGALSGAGRPHDRHHLSGVDPHVDAAQGLDTGPA